MIKKCLQMKSLVVVFVLASSLLGQTTSKDVVTAVQGESLARPSTKAVQRERYRQDNDVRTAAT
jgi:hypothetical protein